MAYKTLAEELREFKGDATCFAVRFFNSFCCPDSEWEELALNMAELIECENYPCPRFTDGSIISTGDCVRYGGETFEVEVIQLFHTANSILFRLGAGNARYTPWLPIDERVEHFEPDSIEKIKEDALKSFGEYWGCGPCDKCQVSIDGKRPNEYYHVDNCVQAMHLDLLARYEDVLES